MIFTTGVPVWLNIACENGHHQDIQLGPQDTIMTDEEEMADFGFECEECGSTSIEQLNISASANQKLEETGEEE